MESVLLRRADQLVELRRVVRSAEQRVVEAARDEHAAAPAAKPAEPKRLGVPGTDDPGRGEPAERLAVQLAPAHIERAIDQDVEHEAGPGAELEHAYAALDAIAERDQSHSSELFEATDPAHQIAPGHRLTPYGGHGCPSFEP